MKTFRFDDVCINADMDLIVGITEYLANRFPDCEILWGVSPLVNHECGERVFPKRYNAFSDYKIFYKVDECGIIDTFHPRAKIAAHGLIHVDHRLLTRGAQEMSILVSANLVKSKIFIPPFNKWNKDTEEICREAKIELIKFEDGWLSMEHNEYDGRYDLWYLHAREWTMDKIKNWFK